MPKILLWINRYVSFFHAFLAIRFFFVACHWCCLTWHRQCLIFSLLLSPLHARTTIKYLRFHDAFVETTRKRICTNMYPKDNYETKKIILISYWVNEKIVAKLRQTTTIMQKLRFLYSFGEKKSCSH